MLNFKDTFETCKRSFISAFSICMIVPLSKIKGKWIILKNTYITRNKRVVTKWYMGDIQLLPSHKMSKMWTPPSLLVRNCSILVTPLLWTFKSLHQPSPSPLPPRHTQRHHHQTLTKTINSVILEIHKQLLKSASINTTKNIPLIWMLPVYQLTEIVLTIKVSIE